MSAADQAKDHSIDRQIILQQYQKVTAIKNGSIFDIVDFAFSQGGSLSSGLTIDADLSLIKNTFFDLGA